MLMVTQSPSDLSVKSGISARAWTLAGDVPAARKELDMRSMDEVGDALDQREAEADQGEEVPCALAQLGF